MTASAQATGSEASLAAAGARMRALGTRYLPVVEGGVLRGVLTERDVVLAEALAPMKLEQLSVGDAMGRDLYPVTEAAPLAHVARAMAKHGYGCAVVMEQGAVTGVFTIEDALRALSDVLEQQRETRDKLSAGDVRAVILTEHAHVHAVLGRAHEAARRLRASLDPQRDLRSAREWARQLLAAVQSLLELEDRLLAPVLAELPGFGRERVQQLVDEHKRQTDETASLLLALDDPPGSAVRLGERLDGFMSNLAQALASEESELLNFDLLRSDSIVADVEAG